MQSTSPCLSPVPNTTSAPSFRASSALIWLQQPQTAVRVFPFQVPHGLTGFPPALGGDGAGIHDDGIRGLPVRCGAVPPFLKQGLYRLRLILVDLTAKSVYNILQ